MPPLSSPLAVGVLALVVGVAFGLLMRGWWGTRAGHRGSASPPPPPHERPTVADAAERLRSQALEAVAEPVLVVGCDGQVLECNAAALTLLDRHRPAVSGVAASAIRALVTPSGLEAGWPELVAARAPWTGEAHVRLPDGSRRAIGVRLIPLFAPSGDMTGVVEVYRDVAARAPEAARFLGALEATDERLEGDEPGAAAERELQLLALGFSDLDRVLRQYERLLPAMRAEDPLTEAIAGLAAETSELTATADVPRLLHEIPQSMTRLRAQLLRLTGATPSGTSRGPEGPPPR